MRLQRKIWFISSETQEISTWLYSKTVIYKATIRKILEAHTQVKHELENGFNLHSINYIAKILDPLLRKSDWKKLSDELKEKLVPVHYHSSRCNNSDYIKALGDQCTITIINFLVEHSELFEEET